MISPILGTVFLALAGLLLATAAGPLRHTTLRGSWRWSLVAIVGWALVGVANLLALPGDTRDRAWYAAAVLTLAPLVHVLGARRPVARSWNGFVILPMLAVLGLPLFTTWSSGPGGSFDVELPPLLGFLLVLIMGAGNYFGTRFTNPALWLAAGLVVIVLSGSTVRPDWLPDRATSRHLGLVLFGLALVSFARRARLRDDSAPPTEGPPATGPRLDPLWREFRDLFGIVWAKRVMDRVNESLAAGQLASRLDLDGIAWHAPEREAAAAVIGDTLAWLLRRFVDPPWAARFDLTLRERTHEPSGESP